MNSAKLKRIATVAAIGAAITPGAAEARTATEPLPAEPEIMMPAKREGDDAPEQERDVRDAAGHLTRPAPDDVATNVVTPAGIATAEQVGAPSAAPVVIAGISVEQELFGAFVVTAAPSPSKTET